MTLATNHSVIMLRSKAYDRRLPAVAPLGAPEGGQAYFKEGFSRTTALATPMMSRLDGLRMGK